MAPIRILHNVVMMDPGGIETQLMRIYRSIDKTKIQFDFLVHRKEKGAYDDEIRMLGGRIFYAEPFNPFKHIKYVKSINKFFEEHNEYKIVLVHSELALWSLISAKKYNVPVRICYSHNGRFKLCLKRIFMDFEKLFLKKYSTHMLAVSELAANYTFGKKTVESGKVILVKNGLIVEDFIFNEKIREEKRKELGLEDKLVFGHVGRFMMQKNHTFLIDIFNEITKIKANAHLILVGEGRLEDEIKEKVKSLGLENKVSFLGRRKDINQLDMAMDAFLLPSFFEGFPNVAIESQATALPTYMSDRITKEAVFTPYCKQICLDESAKYWAEFICEDLDKKLERKDMSQFMKKEGYSVVETAKWYESFYENLIKNIK